MTELAAIEYEDSVRKRGSFKVDGVLIDIGLDPTNSFLENLVSLETSRQIIINEHYETSGPGNYAVVDIRSNAPKQVSPSVGDNASCTIYILYTAVTEIIIRV
jgi:thioredoxin reductase